LATADGQAAVWRLLFTAAGSFGDAEGPPDVSPARLRAANALKRQRAVSRERAKRADRGSKGELIHFASHFKRFTLRG
jgi:hypothetical protein